MKHLALWLILAAATGLASPAIAVEPDPALRFLGTYQGGSNLRDPALPAPAVLREAPLSLTVERTQGDIVLRLSGVLSAEMTFADDETSAFHLIETTAASEKAAGFLRIAKQDLVAHRTEVDSHGEVQHLRLIIFRTEDGVRLLVFAGAGAKSLALATDRQLRRVAEP